MLIGNTVALLKINGVTCLKEVHNVRCIHGKIYFLSEHFEYVFKGDISQYKDFLGSSILDCTTLILVNKIKLSYL